MKAFRIRITKAERETFWYANCIGYVYWAIKNNTDGVVEYSIINEGRGVSKGCIQLVNEGDCEVIEKSNIEIVAITKVVRI